MGYSTMEAPKRGGCLTAFLLVMMVANPLIAIYYLTSGDAVRENLPDLPDWTLPALALFAIVNFACAILIWMWKKIGFYGFAASAVVIAIINTIGLGIGNAIPGLIGVGILWYLLRPSWDQMT